MDGTGAALVEAVAPYGLVPLAVLGGALVTVVAMCAFVLPAWRDKMKADAETARMRVEAEIKMEQEREQRKASDAERRYEHDQERAAIDSRTAVLLEGLKTSIDALRTDQEGQRTELQAFNARVEASGTASRKMGETVEDTNRMVREMHHELIHR